MPSGIYQRKKSPKKKARRAAGSKRAATKKKRGRPPGPAKKKRGRPPGAKTKPAKIKQAAAPRIRKSQGRASSPQLDLSPIIGAINDFGRLLDARSKLLIEAINGIGDAIRETDDPELPAKVAIAEADKQAGAAQGEPAPVS